MLEYSLRFNVEEKRRASFHEFVTDSQESLRGYDRLGWDYKGIYCTLYNLGTGPEYELRFNLQNWAALDAPFETSSRIVVSQFFRYIADAPTPIARIQRPVDEVNLIEPW